MKKLFAALIISSVLLAACGGPNEKERFTDATVEVACMVFESGNPFDPELEQKTKDVFSKYDFDVEDEEKMEEIAAKYENDTDVQAAVEGALRECAGELFEALESLDEGAASDAAADEAATEEAAPAEEAVTEE